MSAISDLTARINTALDNAIVRTMEDVATQDAEITRLKALVAQGGATPEELAALEALVAKADGLDPIKPDVLPPDVVASARSRASRR